MTDTERRRRRLRSGPSAGTGVAADVDASTPDDLSAPIDTLTADSPRGASAVTTEVQDPEPDGRTRGAKSAGAARRGAAIGRGAGGPTSGRGTSGGTATSRGAGAASSAGVPEDRETERGLRGLVGSGASQVGTSAALRARDAARPSDADLSEAEERLVIVRRNWVPREDLPRAGR